MLVAKNLIYYTISEWFYGQNFEKFNLNFLKCLNMFTNEDVIKETEKAVLVKFSLYKKFNPENPTTEYSRNIWLPKRFVKVLKDNKGDYCLKSFKEKPSFYFEKLIVEENGI